MSSADARALKTAANSFVASALRTLDAEREGIAALAAAMRDGLGAPFVAAVETIRSARGRVIVTGMGKSGHIARKIAATLASTGSPAFFVHAADASHGDLGMITSDDVMLVLSWSGETEELKDLINYSRRFRIALIAATVNAESTLGKAADVVLALPAAREACPHNLAPTTSSLMQLALGDALAIALLESRGFSAIDFGVFHPRGKLGAALKFVRDIMHPGRSHTADQAGSADVGSDRRNVRQGLSGAWPSSTAAASSPASSLTAICAATCAWTCCGRPSMTIMTASPKTVRPDQLAGEALQLLNSSKITALIVVESERPVGIVHFHDLLRAGVA